MVFSMITEEEYSLLIKRVETLEKKIAKLEYIFKGPSMKEEDK